MSNMPEYDVAALDENAERIDGQVEDVKAKILQEIEAKAAHDKTIMALDAGVRRLQADAKKLRRMAEGIRQKQIERLAGGNSELRQAGEPNAAGNGGPA